jgi:hypothetical protein
MRVAYGKADANCALCYECRRRVDVSCASASLRPSTHRQVKSNESVTFKRTFVTETVCVLKMNRLVGQLEREECGICRAIPRNTLLVHENGRLWRTAEFNNVTEATILLPLLAYILLKQKKCTCGITVHVSMSLSPLSTSEQLPDFLVIWLSTL